MDANLTALQRLFLAFVAFFAVLFNRRFAEEVHLLRERQRGALPPAPAPGGTPVADAAPPPAAQRTVEAPPAEPAPRPAPPPASAVNPDAASLHVLALLQRDGRLIDFLSEDLTGFTDAEIGAAARTVHVGCRKVLDAYLELEPVYREQEGARITVAAGFDPAAVRVTGNVVGAPPFTGSLRHHGWRASRASFPPLPPAHDPRILAPAEVEL
jgi:hypothetical protein